MSRPVLAVLLACAVTCPAMAADSQKGKGAGTVILSDPAQGRTIGKVDGETVVLQDTANGTVGRIGKDKVLLHSDGKGNTMGKVGKDTVFCHTNPATGLTLCK